MRIHHLTFSANGYPTDMARMKNRHIVITGGASGIGAATAARFLDEGAKVAIWDRDPAALSAVQGNLPGALTVQCDITDPEQVDDAIDRSLIRMDGCDGLVNCAAVDTIMMLEDSDAAILRRMMEVNIIAPILLAKAMVRVFETGSTIVNLASAAAVRPLPGRSGYCASKAGVSMATKVLALELGARNIRANVVCPGVVDTPMLRGHWADVEDPQAARAEAMSRNVLGRIASPEEIVDGILYLSSHESSFVTGSTLVIDGGRAFL